MGKTGTGTMNATTDNQELSDYRAFFRAFMLMHTPIWPNDWCQDVAMLACHVHRLRTAASNAGMMPADFDRAPETSRRIGAVELLLSMGYVWNDGAWKKSD